MTTSTTRSILRETCGALIQMQPPTDFDRLRTALAGRGGSRAPFLYAFDLLAIDGEDLRARVVRAQHIGPHRLDELAADCPRKSAADISDQCQRAVPGLAKGGLKSRSRG
jgi:hypothetical protein